MIIKNFFKTSFLLLLCVTLCCCGKTEQTEKNIFQQLDDLCSENSNYTCELIISNDNDLKFKIYKGNCEYLLEFKQGVGGYEHNMPDLFLDQNDLNSYLYLGNGVIKEWGVTGFSSTGHGNGLIGIEFLKNEYSNLDNHLLEKFKGQCPFFILEKTKFHYDSLNEINSNKYSLSGTCFDYYLPLGHKPYTFDIKCDIILEKNKIISIEIYIDNEQFILKDDPWISLYIEEPIQMTLNFYNSGNTVVDVSGYEKAGTFEKRVPDF
jgi:hypothetical protein